MKVVSANMSIEKQVSRLQESRENFVVGYPKTCAPCRPQAEHACESLLSSYMIEMG